MFYKFFKLENKLSFASICISEMGLTAGVSSVLPFQGVSHSKVSLQYKSCITNSKLCMLSSYEYLSVNPHPIPTLSLKVYISPKGTLYQSAPHIYRFIVHPYGNEF